MTDRAAFVDPFEQAGGRPDFVDPFETQAEPLKLSTRKEEIDAAAAARGAGKSFFDFNPFTGPVHTLSDLASRAIGPLQYPLAAIGATTGFLGGHPLAGLEQLAGEYVANPLLRRAGVPEEDLQHPTHQQLYEQAEQDVNKALSAAGPARGASIATTATPFGQMASAVQQDIAGTQVENAIRAANKAAERKAAQPPPPEAAQAEEALKQAGYTDLNIPRAVTTPSETKKAAGVALSKFPVIGSPLREAVQAVPGRVGSELEGIAAQHGTLPEETVGGRIGQTLGAAGEQEAAAAEAQAQQAHQQAVAAHQQASQEAEGAIRAREIEAVQNAERQFGNIHPTEMAERTTQDVQSAHAAAEKADQARWAQVRELDAPVSQKAFDNLHGDIEQGLNRKGVTLGAETTPNARAMMGEIGRLTPGAGTEPTNLNPRLLAGFEKEYGAGNIPEDVIRQFGGEPGKPAKPPDFRLMGEHAPQAGDTHVTAQGLDELRKRISQMAYDARTPQDYRASKAIKGLFEQKLADTFENHLLPGGDANANDVIRAAVSGHRTFKEKFGYNYGDLPRGLERKAADELNQIATGNAGPTSTALNLVGHMPGGVEVSHPLYQRILGAVENPGAVRDRLRAAYWRETNARTPDVAANRITELASSPMGKELFTPEELGQMHEVGRIRQQTPVDLARAKEVIGKEPKYVKPTRGEAQQLAESVAGARSNEKVYANLDAMARGGDARTFSRAWQAMSEENRNDFRGQFIRNLGREGDNFSLAKFAKEWDKYPPQSKAAIFGSGGPQGIQHFADLNNFHRIAKEYVNTIARYGNPSGTAPMTMWHKIFAGLLKGGAGLTGAAAFHLVPGSTIGVAAVGLGLRKFATILAKPQGARELSRWAKMAEAYNKRPSTSSLLSLSRMSRSLEDQGNP